MLSIIVSWRDRKELGRALPGLAAAARGVGGEVVVVNYGGAVELLREQLDAATIAPQVVEVHGERYFNKARAQNIGAAHSDRELIFFCDCDIVVQPDVIAALVRRIVDEPGTFVTLAGVRESELNARGARHVVSFGYELKIRTADGRSLSIIDNEEDSRDGTRQAPGLLLVRRRDFLAVNGYNGRLHGWGWEDQDMISRLTLGAGLRRISDGKAIHLSHDDQARIAHYPPVKDRWESRDRMFRAALANYDEANFRGTYAEDVAALKVRAA